MLQMLLSIHIISAQNDFEQYKKDREEAFSAYKDSVQARYSEYTKKEKEAREQFKKDVKRKWQEYKESTNKTYMSYSQDMEARAGIYFEDGYIELEAIIEEGSDDGSLNFHYNKIYDSVLASDLSNRPLAITSILFTMSHSFWELQKGSDKKRGFQSGRFLKVSKKLVRQFLDIFNEKAGDGYHLLKDQIATSAGKLINTTEAASGFINDILKKKLKKGKKYKSKDGRAWSSYTIKIPLRPEHKIVRKERYEDEIKYQSERFNISFPIAMAITETESSFNPKATSHVPAYGLMQLVPSTGARDAYAYVYNKDKFLSKRYLYDPKNNIELGCAYIARIRHGYLKSIYDDEKAYMCTVAAYNTGPGNVAKTLTNTKKLAPATRKANSMSESQLYLKLVQDLEYKETRDYLKKVWSRKEKYQ